jgi:hypothetical protein
VKKSLLKTANLEVMWLAVQAQETVSESRTEGETVFHCLEGKAAFTAYGKTLLLEPANLLYLPREEFVTV